MKKRLQREIEADSEDDDGDNIRDISFQKKSANHKPTPKRSRKDKFLDGDYSSEENELNHQVLSSENQEIFSSRDIPKFLEHNDIRNSLDFQMTMKRTQVKKVDSIRKVGVTVDVNRIGSIATRSKFGTPNEFLPLDDYRPSFTKDFIRSSEDIVLGKDRNSDVVYKVNQFVARYLIDHQVEGIRWMFAKYANNDSAILGDDMGMGKTVQVAGLLNVIFMKQGTIYDQFISNYKRNGSLLTMLESELSTKSLLSSPSAHTRSLVTLLTSNTRMYKLYASCKPVLIVCPKSLVDNWEREIRTWGFFIVDVLSRNDDSSDDILLRARESRSEIVLLSYSLVNRFVRDLKDIEWDLIIFDEGHKLKNEKSKSYKDIMKIKHCACRLLLTGTPVQNDLKELWAILNLVYNGQFASKAEFTREIEKPIKRGMSAKATKRSVKLATIASKELQSLLKECLLQRHKTMLRGHHALKGKEEIIVFCDLSPIQQAMYEQCLSCPDFDNVRYHATICPCGSGEVRGHCCPQYRVPYMRTRGAASSPKIDRRAVLWRQFHPQDHPCEGTLPVTSSKLASASSTESTNLQNKDNLQNMANNTSKATKRITCPLCMLLPCLNKLGKIACHPALLQADTRSHDIIKQRQAEEFLSYAFDPSVVAALGGVQRSTRFMTMKSTQDSGKMKTLLEMLRFFMKHNEKTLIFSLSTQVLDLLEAMVISEGWRCLRLDGNTPAKKRQQLVDEFNCPSNTSMFSTGPVNIFLISSRAGGLGLNLSTASKVIIFDVDWNPVVDMQSQDRAYRIGQKEHVTVYRLVAKGTVEELAYMRQLYKQQLQQTVLGKHQHPSKGALSNKNLSSAENKKSNNNDGANEPSSSSTDFKRGSFEGVEGDSTMRGELFGVENLFQFSKHSILQAMRARYRTSSNRASDVQFGSPARGIASREIRKPVTSGDQMNDTERQAIVAPVSLSEIAFDDEDKDAEWTDLTERSMAVEDAASLLAGSSAATTAIDASMLSSPHVMDSMSLTESETDPVNTSHAYQLLLSIGIDLRDARKNEDMLTNHHANSDDNLLDDDDDDEQDKEEGDNSDSELLSITTGEQEVGKESHSSDSELAADGNINTISSAEGSSAEDDKTFQKMRQFATSSTNTAELKKEEENGTLQAAEVVLNRSIMSNSATNPQLRHSLLRPKQLQPQQAISAAGRSLLRTYDVTLQQQLSIKSAVRPQMVARNKKLALTDVFARSSSAAGNSIEPMAIRTEASVVIARTTTASATVTPIATAAVAVGTVENAEKSKFRPQYSPEKVQIPAIERVEAPENIIGDQIFRSADSIADEKLVPFEPIATAAAASVETSSAAYLRSYVAPVMSPHAPAAKSADSKMSSKRTSNEIIDLQRNDNEKNVDHSIHHVLNTREPAHIENPMSRGSNNNRVTSNNNKSSIVRNANETRDKMPIAISALSSSTVARPSSTPNAPAKKAFKLYIPNYT